MRSALRVLAKRTVELLHWNKTHKLLSVFIDIQSSETVNWFYSQFEVLMNKPTEVKFSNLVLTGSKLEDYRAPEGHIANRTSWTRTVFNVPTSRDAVHQVYEWLAYNCQGQYSAYKFHDTTSYTEYKMVVRFENKNDAILFKLQDGHRAWEHRKA